MKYLHKQKPRRFRAFEVSACVKGEFFRNCYNRLDFRNQAYTYYNIFYCQSL